MKNFRDLKMQLVSIDGRGYKAYESIRGQYQYDKYILSIDHVQGDPFAPPSKVRIIVKQENAGFPKELYDTRYKRIAAADFLTRLFDVNIRKHYSRKYGTGKSGIIAMDKCGQEIIDRTSIIIDKNRVEARFEVGLPAQGRTISGGAADVIFLEAIPQIVKNSLFYDAVDSMALVKQVELSEDQFFLRKGLEDRNLMAFIADGSIIPRESGISDMPMRSGAVPFMSPDTLAVEFNLPHRGKIRGMGISGGVTVIVGGGYHGKSTLLNAIERGVYNHIAGDGREFVITRDNAVKIRAEDGRGVEKVDISPFINNLPNGQDTRRFSTDNASGSTSQAANIMEALEIGTDLLLIDEDTCAANFMFRDEIMTKLVQKEPIIPFISKVRGLYRDHNVSTILVAGSSGDYFQEADRVIMLEDYSVKDVTAKAKEIAAMSSSTDGAIYDEFGEITQRVILKTGFSVPMKGIKIKARGLSVISYDHEDIDLRFLEQLVDPSQTNAIASILVHAIKYVIDEKSTVKQVVDSIMDVILREGLDGICGSDGHPGDFALPRKCEIAGALNRYRHLTIK